MDKTLSNGAKTVKFLSSRNFLLVFVLSLVQWSTISNFCNFCFSFVISFLVHKSLDLSITVSFSCTTRSLFIAFQSKFESRLTLVARLSWSNTWSNFSLRKELLNYDIAKLKTLCLPPSGSESTRQELFFFQICIIQTFYESNPIKTGYLYWISLLNIRVFS